VNGDGHPDLVLTDSSSQELDVLLGNGDGTFAPGPQHAVSEPFTFYAAMDMDADGREEVVAQAMYASTSIDVLSHLADASFVEQSAAPVSSGLPMDLDYGGVAAQFTRSGAAGLAGFAGSSAVVLLPQKDASYGQTAVIGGGFAVADVDGDGLADVLATSASFDAHLDQHPNIEANLSQGDGTFHRAPALNLPLGFHYLGAGDVDGDHHVDLVGLYAGPPSFVALLKGHGDGTFEGPTAFTADGEWFTGAWLTADFDGDGRLDVAVRPKSGGILVLRGACSVQ
jgi:hypothetical protein